jgi:hypothetical protein
VSPKGFAASLAAGSARPSGGGKRKFPQTYRDIKSPIGRRVWLCGDECRAMIDSGQIQQNQVEKELRRLDEGRKIVAAVSPSPARVDENQRTGLPFPPPADDPACQMREARHVLNPSVEARTLWPAVYLSSRGATDDRMAWELEKRKARIEGRDPHRRNYSTTESPSADANAALADRQGELVSQVELLPESTAALEREIAAHAALVMASVGAVSTVSIPLGN